MDVRDRVSLERLGIDIAKYASLDYERTQAVAAAVQFLECDGLLVPSARYDGSNLVLFADRIELGVMIGVMKTEPVDWTSWCTTTRRMGGGDDA